MGVIYRAQIGHVGTIGHEIENDKVSQPQEGDKCHVRGPQVPLPGRVDEIENPNLAFRDYMA